MQKKKEKSSKGSVSGAKQGQESTALVEERAIPTLSSKERQLLQHVSRFLIGIAASARASRALREGYTTDEHQEGWRLWRLGAGEAITLDHWFDDLHATAQAKKNISLDDLKQIDTFENLWFPRTKAIIQRVVPREHRETFLEVFFKDLSQQPLGPGVIQSVGTFLQRVEGLHKSKLSGAKEVAATLVARGLTDEVRKKMLVQIQQAQAVQSGPEVNVPSAKARQKVAEERATALHDLADWYNDWRTTLSPIFSGNDAIALGFQAHKGGRSSAVEGVEPDEEEVSPS